MKKFILPNWKKSNLNISATLAEFLGAPNHNETLKVLKKELLKSYKNVVFICFDGMGINPLKINLDKNDFLRKNIKKTLTSTFPSTTTNATTSLTNNQLPLEHGWFGWSMYFKNMNKNINIFRNTDSWTDEKLEITSLPLGKLDFYFDHDKCDYEVHSIMPYYAEVQRKDRNHPYYKDIEFFETIKNICQQDGKQFIYAYYPEPDSTMHKFGVTSSEAKKVIDKISNYVKNLFDETQSTLFIISADHGQIDVEGYVELYKDETLMKMLKIYPFLEARAPAFIVKDGMHADFEKYFKKTYGKDFKLFKSSQLIKKGLFGKVGDKGGLLGDYIAIGTYTNKQAVLTPASKKFKGHHTSLTAEMKVPLIIINN